MTYIAYQPPAKVVFIADSLNVEWLTWKQRKFAIKINSNYFDDFKNVGKTVTKRSTISGLGSAPFLIKIKSNC